ncbi:hypothetical protein J6590_032085 [Homalodisca vitripennis]|nr:hypothetical protein J6590_032085 [Homalodisca vitripennis]
MVFYSTFNGFNSLLYVQDGEYACIQVAVAWGRINRSVSSGQRQERYESRQLGWACDKKQFEEKPNHPYSVKTDPVTMKPSYLTRTLPYTTTTHYCLHRFTGAHQ